jgi:hypothetical protein
LFTATNDQGSAINRCQPVYAKANGKVALAEASAVLTADVIGFVEDASIADGLDGAIQNAGVLVATTDEWDAVTDETGGLTEGARYYLSTTAGKLTVTPPTEVGEILASLGVAMDTTRLVINIQTPIEI